MGVLLEILHAFLCLFKFHDWTSKALEGIPFTKEEIADVEKTIDYTKMYCKHCNVESEISKKVILRMKSALMESYENR